MISKTGEYVLRAAVCLAECYPEARTTGMIAAATSVPAGYLSKVLQSLGRTGIVISRRGMGGGFALARNPEDISILDILLGAGVGFHRIRQCPLGIPGHTRLCPLHRLVDERMQMAEDAFRQATLASLFRSADGIVPLHDAKAPETTQPSRSDDDAQDLDSFGLKSV